MVKKRKYVIVIIIGCVLMTGIFLLLLERETISEEIADAFHLRKGTAKWSHTLSSNESKKKGVFVCYYDALPFEYEDSVFQMKLVFDEVYVEWCHWYQWPDTLQKRCLYYKNSETVKGQQLVGIYNEDSSMLGLSRILKSNYHNGEDIYVTYPDSLKYLKDFASILSQNEESIPLFYWESICGQYPILFFDQYEYGRQFNGDDTSWGIFPDTIKIPIYSSRGYNKLCGYNEYTKLSFGELVFVKRK